MAQANFSLREKDKKRRLKDRLVRLAVSAGGMSVLAALVLIFVYLAMVIMPLLSDAQIETKVSTLNVATEKPVYIKIDDYGQLATLIYPDSRIHFISMPSNQMLGDGTTINRNDEALTIPPISPDPIAFARTPPGVGWFGVVDKSGRATIFNPELRSATDDISEIIGIKRLPAKYDLQITTEGDRVNQFVFSVKGSSPTFLWQTESGKIAARWFETKLSGEIKTVDFQFSSAFDIPDQMLLSPDGAMLYLRYGSELIILRKRDIKFEVREVLDLTLAGQKQAVRNIDFLAGAYSLLITHSDGHVSQWFDTLQPQGRVLTHVRDFKLASELEFLLPDSYRKGFYSFYTNGTLQSHYTTSEKLVLFKRAFENAPQLAAMSNNERYLLTWKSGVLSLAEVDNPYPEVSLSSLWGKVWYEGYSEPEYVWQSSSGSADFEAKFSLVPIIFGTLKAATFAMLFAIPLAVLGAIYTAYFMSPKMRRIVKPSIELMEALPTVIIGFLAGLWLAPMIENHLITVVVLVAIVPIITMVIGGFWGLMPARIRHRVPNGWHALILMPAIILFSAIGLWLSPFIEQHYFAGDIRLFLSDHGIGFNQRNALVVGIAMGFAVIPTIFTIAEDAIFSVPKHLSDGSLALGATPWQTLIYVVLLTASPGIFSAIMMGLGRAVGETMIVLMATGNTPLMDWNILEGMRSLSATIAVEMPESEVGSSHYRLLFLSALILFIFTFAVNSVAEWVRQRLRDKYRAL